jgi:hypothetical protein
MKYTLLTILRVKFNVIGYMLIFKRSSRTPKVERLLKKLGKYHDKKMRKKSIRLYTNLCL